MYPWLARYQSLLPEDRRAWPQALLICGSTDAGTLEWAQVLTAFLLCHQPQQKQACGQCQSCHWLQAGYHPDFLSIIKNEDEKNIKVDAIREMSAHLTQTTHSQGARVILIYPVDSLNNAAANALLKSLEEPKAKTHFLLITERPLHLPATIRSRCQMIRVQANQQQSLQWLKTQFPDKEEAELQQVFCLERCLPLAANRVLAQKEETSSLTEWLADCVAIGLGQKKALPVAQKWAGQVTERHIRAWGYLFQDVVRYIITSKHLFSMNNGMEKAINQLSLRYSLKIWTDLCQSIWVLYYEVVQGLNLNFQLSLEYRLLCLEQGWGRHDV